TTTPTPPSTKDERAQVMAGLVADRANARYSEQPARTMPVAVRPLSDLPPPPAASTAAVARLDAAPPARPADAGSATATPAPPAAEAAGPAGPSPRSTAALVGPRRVAPTGPSNDDDDAAPAGPGAAAAPRQPQLGNGFRTLTEFDSTIYGAGHLLATLDFPAGSLSASERSELGGAATKQQQTRGVVRVIGHGPTKTSAADRATTVARELERLGVPRDQIFTGSETASGPTEVFVHY
ncbi:MAG: OmpA family protein, partial [Rhodospirillaceae bacterium]